MTTELSNREREVVDLLRLGKSNKLIAQALGISERTVEFHLNNIYARFGVNSRLELILRLGNAAETPASEKLVDSTVAQPGKEPENRPRFHSWTDWTASFREAVSLLGKELRMRYSLDAAAPGDTTSMTFFESIRICLTKYAEFEGRAARPEFWWFALFVTLAGSAMTYISEAVGAIFLIAVLLPFLAVGARRLRDTDHSVWWLLFLLVPVGGLVILGTFWVLPSSETAPEEPSPA